MFESIYRKVWSHSPIPFPDFSGTRIMMMPVRLGVMDGIPLHYQDLISRLYAVMELRHVGQIGYLTIDEQELVAGNTLRWGGLHVDGYYKGWLS